ncbi:hypothetical protein F5879DRAFT_952854 [Lentinula edodes]|nr:hypothetical protein F5879DRAFT_952854 [Lentinula edodes]
MMRGGSLSRCTYVLKKNYVQQYIILFALTSLLIPGIIAGSKGLNRQNDFGISNHQIKFPCICRSSISTRFSDWEFDATGTDLQSSTEG